LIFYFTAQYAKHSGAGFLLSSKDDNAVWRQKDQRYCARFIWRSNHGTNGTNHGTNGKILLFMPYYMLLVQKMTYCNLRVLYFSHNKTQTETAERQKGQGESDGLFIFM